MKVLQENGTTKRAEKIMKIRPQKTMCDINIQTKKC